MKKKELVEDVFSSVAAKYDIMNDFMSIGLHRLWKNSMIKVLQPQNHETLLDLAGGTGDISHLFVEKGGGKAILCDINYQMIINGIYQRKSSSKIDFICGNAEEIPIKDNQFDSCSISFGIRNVVNITQSLKEIFRTLKPMGKFVCLEFLNCDPSLFSKIYNQYSYRLIPLIGQIVTNRKDAYQYLVESIRSFPKSEDFIDMIREAGFDKITMQKVFPPVAAIYICYKR